MVLRNLQSSDLFAMVKILNKLGIKNIKDSIDMKEIREARKNITKENEKEVASEIGTMVIMSIITIVLENLPEIENDLYKFIGGIANIKDKDVAKMGINEFTDLLFEIANKEDFKDFFKRASKLIR